MEWEQGEELRSLRARESIGMLPMKERPRLEELEEIYQRSGGVIHPPIELDVDYDEDKSEKK